MTRSDRATSDSISRDFELGANRVDLLQQLPGFVMVTSGPDHLIEFANAELAMLVRYRDIVGKTLRDALPELVRQGFLDIRDEVYRTGTPYRGRQVPFSLQRAPEGPLEDGHIDFVYQPIKREDGNVSGIIFAGYDISEQKAAQDSVKLLQAELIQMSRASAMGAMAGTLAHELNQPLAAISNYATGAKKRLAEETQEGRKNVAAALNGIAQASRRATEIIRHVQEMIRKRGPVSGRFDLALTVTEAAGIGLLDAPSRGVSCAMHLAPGLFVEADRIQVQQVIFNLLRNAIEAMDGCANRQLEVSLVEQDGNAEVRVSDTGRGLPSEAKKWLFEPFMTTKENGLGIGLSICRTIIDGHGGKIWAEDKPGGGTTFCVSLPLA